eukprot:TRINITY_DN6701_c0_g1_i3.p1 TRINITY_DN6701_c0_g1~~TRINITY_DN6701_c0_g1_i3.p1  ORF type:complete len:664 (-),score=123.29 TRINITY_DN6701_c0_g1_i3:1102-3093(-)
MSGVNDRVLTTSSIWGNFTAPYQTSPYWTNVMLGNNIGWDKSERVMVYPYLTSVADDGVELCFALLDISNVSVVSKYQKDFSVRAHTGHHRKFTKIDHLGFTMNYKTDTGEADFIFVRGSPFMTLFLKDSQAKFDTHNIVLSINGIVPYSSKIVGREFKVKLSNGQTWLIFALNGDITLSLSKDRQHISVLEIKYTGFIRVALMYQDEDYKYLVDHKDKIVIGGDVDTDLTDDSGKYSFNWISVNKDYQIVPNTEVLVLGLPHHRDHISGNVKRVMKDTYPTYRGSMDGYIGKQWIFKESLSPLLWNAPRKMDSDKIELIKKTLRKEKDLQPREYVDAIYTAGKFVASLARLAIISDELEETQLATHYRKRVKTILDYWLDGTKDLNTSRIVYDSLWGGIISKKSWENSGEDHRNGIYNDHHFHYGYFIYSIAVILKSEPNYKYKGIGQQLVRDYMNPSTSDPYYPITRHKDWYLGHSWAQGIARLADGKDQESSSEAINAYYSVVLFGHVTKQKDIYNLGRLMLATEIRSVQTYWQITPPSTIYPSIFADQGVVGIVWDDKVDHLTYFGDSKTEYIHCIQMLPFVPPSEELLAKSWLDNDWEILKAVLDDPTLKEEWKSYVLQGMAIVEKEGAWKLIQTVQDEAYGLGNSRTNAYWWVATRL